MTNEEKAKEIVKKLFDSNKMTTFEALMEMAEWKDEQKRQRFTDNFNFD